MVKAWLYNEDGTDKQTPHQCDPLERIDLNKLKERTGIICLQINPENYENEKAFKQLREERGYRSFDVVECCDKLPGYGELLNRFYQEHIHHYEEVRFFLEGSGYFDVRDIDDNWVRIWTEKGDVIILPPGIYHRFTCDQQNYAKVLRLFTQEPNWISIPRPADDHPARKLYLKLAAEKFVSV